MYLYLDFHYQTTCFYFCIDSLGIVLAMTGQFDECFNLILTSGQDLHLHIYLMN